MSGVLLTGASGLLGRYLLRDLLLAGEQVFVLIRSRADGIPARLRIDDALRYFEQTLGRTLPRPLVLEGSLNTDGLGLPDADRQWLARQRPTVLHCAASIKFQRQSADNEPYESNVEGTRRLLAFCEEVGLTEFHHVSTAYVCGNRTGVVLESDFDCGQEFRNDYEHSKFTSEQLVRGAKFLNAATIYRPSIIVGDSETGFTSTYHGFYLPLQLAHVATSAGMFQDAAGYMAVLGLKGNERKNVVPVNWVSKALVHLFRDSKTHGRTHHLTSPEPIHTAAIERVIVEAIDRSLKHRPVAPAAVHSPIQLEEFRNQMQVYAAYLSNDPDFDRSHTEPAIQHLPCPRLDHATLLKLALYAIDHQFGWPRSRPQPFELDVESLIQRVPKSRDSQSGFCLRFEVTGSGGGVWDLAVRQGIPAVIDGRPADSYHVCAYLNVHTLGKILGDETTLAASLSSGGVVLEGPQELLKQSPDVLEALCSQFRQAQWDRRGERERARATTLSS